MKKSYVFVPGAWMGDWVWRELSQLLQNKGHDVRSLTLTGLDANSNADPANIHLATHVQDIIDYLQTNQFVTHFGWS